MILFLASYFFFLGGGVFLKRNKVPITSPDPIPIDPPIPNPNDPLTLSLDLTPQFFFIILPSPGFELQTSDFEVHLHLHFATQAIVANLHTFVGLISYWPQTHPFPLTHINPV